MPAYLYKACAGKPTFNINIPRYGLCDEKLHEYEDAVVKDIERESERILRETKFEGTYIFLSTSFVLEAIHKIRRGEACCVETLR